MKQPGPHVEDKLLDFAYGELATGEAQAVEEHLHGCASCAEALSSIQGVRRVMSRLPVETAPEAGLESLLGYAAQAARRQAAGPAPAPAWWRRWLAPVVGVTAVAVVGLVAGRVAKTMPSPSERVAEVAAPAAPPARSVTAVAAPVAQLDVKEKGGRDEDGASKKDLRVEAKAAMPHRSAHAVALGEAEAPGDARRASPPAEQPEEERAREESAPEPKPMPAKERRQSIIEVIRGAGAKPAGALGDLAGSSGSGASSGAERDDFARSSDKAPAAAPAPAMAPPPPAVASAAPRRKAATLEAQANQVASNTVPAEPPAADDLEAQAPKQEAAKSEEARIASLWAAASRAGDDGDRKEERRLLKQALALGPTGQMRYDILDRLCTFDDDATSCEQFDREFPGVIATRRAKAKAAAPAKAQKAVDMPAATPVSR